jgi:hypothetical protein
LSSTQSERARLHRRKWTTAPLLGLSVDGQVPANRSVACCQGRAVLPCRCPTRRTQGETPFNLLSTATTSAVAHAQDLLRAGCRYIPSIFITLIRSRCALLNARREHTHIFSPLRPPLDEPAASPSLNHCTSRTLHSPAFVRSPPASQLEALCSLLHFTLI